MDQTVPKMPLVERVVRPSRPGRSPGPRHVLAPNDPGVLQGVREFRSQ